MMGQVLINRPTFKARFVAKALDASGNCKTLRAAPVRCAIAVVKPENTQRVRGLILVFTSPCSVGSPAI